MDALLKRYFWVVNLAAIAVMAYLVATGINSYLAARLFAVPTAQAGTRANDASGRVSLGRVSASDAAAALEGRRVFMLETPAEEPEVIDDGGDIIEPVKPPEVPTGALEESALPIDLMGTMVSGDSATSIATLSIEGESKLAWVGTEVLDGKAKLVGIAPRHIVVEEEGRRKIIRLWTERQAQVAGPGGRPTPGRPGPVPGGPPRGRPPGPEKPAPADDEGKADLAKGVKKTGAYDYEIDRGMLDQQLADLSSLGREARIVPNYRGGKYEGFKLVGVRPGSLYRTIGIRSGDVVKSINGRPIDSPNKAIELFEKLKSSSNITLEVERRGQTKQLNYNIK